MDLFEKTFTEEISAETLLFPIETEVNFPTEKGVKDVYPGRKRVLRQLHVPWY